MEATQAIDHGSTDDDVDDEFSEEFRSKVVAKLRLVNAGPDLDGVEMDVKGGENNIGRDAERCSIPIQAKVCCDFPEKISFLIIAIFPEK